MYRLLASLALSFVVGCGVVAGTKEVETNNSVSRAAASSSTVQSDSLVDRVINHGNFAAFHAATENPAVSPKAGEATSRDFIYENSELVSPVNTKIVILKPRSNSKVYQIPDPAPGEDLFSFFDEHLEAARDAQVGLVRFPERRVLEIQPPTIGARHIKFSGFRDTIIDLNSSTIVLKQISLGLLIEDSHRVTIRNGTIHSNHLLATVAVVQPDTTAAGIRFEVLPEYRPALLASSANPGLVTVGSAIKGSDGFWKTNVPAYAELFVNRGTPVNNFSFEAARSSFVATAPLAKPSDFKPGQHVWLQHQNNGGHAVMIDNESGVEDLTLEDLVFQGIPGMTIVGEVVRGLHLSRIAIRRRPNDPLAVVGNSSDSIHINANGGDIAVEDCLLGPNFDDKINIKGNYWKISTLDAASRTATVVPVDRDTSVNRWGWRGQKLVFIKGSYEIVGTANLDADSVRDNGKKHLIRLDRIPSGVALGSILANVDNAGTRILVRRNRMEQSRAQGVLAQTSNLIIVDNYFEGIAGPAIKFNLALGFWYEAVSPKNVLVKNNTFSNSSQSLAKSNELIYFHEEGPGGVPVQIIDKVRIAGNRLMGSPILPVPPPVIVPPPVPPVLPPPVVNPPMVSSELAVIYLNKAPRSLSSRIEAKIEMANKLETAVNLRGVELRYYVNLDNLAYRLSLMEINCPRNSVRFQVMGSGANAYVSLTFLKDTYVGGLDRFEVQFSIVSTTGALFSQANDYSFVSAATVKTNTDRIPLLRDGRLIAGRLP